MLTDPDTVEFRVRPPFTPTAMYTYGTHDRVERTAEGTFTCWVDPDRSGTWHYGVVGTGAAKGAEEHQFVVRDSKVS